MRIEKNKIAQQGLIFCSFLFVMFLVGCTGGLSKPDPQLVAEPDTVVLRLADAANRATQALETLAEVEQVKTPTPVAARPENVPMDLNRHVTITWVGPVAQIAAKMAARANYSFAELGDRPPVPIVVNVDVINEPVINILRGIGLQMGQRGSIVVDGTKRVVEVHYAPTLE